MFNENLSIESVQAEFTDWRNNKSRRNEKIPTTLWDQVRILLKSNKCSVVLKSLSLTTEQARDNGLLPPVITKDIEDNSFVNITMPPKLLEARHTSVSGLTITRGEATCILSNPTIEQMQLVITTFIR